MPMNSPRRKTAQIGERAVISGEALERLNDVALTVPLHEVTGESHTRLAMTNGGNYSGSRYDLPQAPGYRSRTVSEGVAEETRTPGFATPAFAGCAFIEVWCR